MISPGGIGKFLVAYREHERSLNKRLAVAKFKYMSEKFRQDMAELAEQYRPRLHRKGKP